MQNAKCKLQNANCEMQLQMPNSNATRTPNANTHTHKTAKRKKNKKTQSISPKPDARVQVDGHRGIGVQRRDPAACLQVELNECGHVKGHDAALGRVPFFQKGGRSGIRRRGIDLRFERKAVEQPIFARNVAGGVGVAVAVSATTTATTTSSTSTCWWVAKKVVDVDKRHESVCTNKQHLASTAPVRPWNDAPHSIGVGVDLGRGERRPFVKRRFGTGIGIVAVVVRPNMPHVDDTVSASTQHEPTAVSCGRQVGCGKDRTCGTSKDLGAFVNVAVVVVAGIGIGIGIGIGRRPKLDQPIVAPRHNAPPIGTGMQGANGTQVGPKDTPGPKKVLLPARHCACTADSTGRMHTPSGLAAADAAFGVGHDAAAFFLQFALVCLELRECRFALGRVLHHQALHVVQSRVGQFVDLRQVCVGGGFAA